MKRAENTMILAFTAVGLFACENPVKKAIRNTQYSAYEMVGVQKRDLLKNRIEDARDNQKEASEDFTDALTQLKKVYGFKGGDLEKVYESLKSSYDRSEKQAGHVRKSITKVETVAGDLFKEWENELNDMETASLKAQSQKRLGETKSEFEKLRVSLRDSEKRMDPVLKKLKDYTLYLKHNLNAKAIGSLKGEANNITKDIEALIKEMNEAIVQSEKFIAEMPRG